MPTAPTAADILSAPLPQLLAAHNAELHLLDVGDARWLGGGWLLADGRILLGVPSGFDRDALARLLLAQILGIDVGTPDGLEIHRLTRGGDA
ncbi:hypothetical protein [Streptomyces sp. DW26H14]|uniref:hypothetical protein n=1 Tax=Streptomyces sp. DW26H14 TaxID=3435395 RepID=UPI00403D5C7D